MTYAFGGAGGGGGLPEKETKNPFGPDIIHNLFDDVEEAAIGVFTAPWYLGKSVAGDAKRLVTGEGNFTSDDMVADIAKTTWRDIKWRWSPLVGGDFKEFYNRVEEHPLGMILDVATIATLGGAGVGKAGQAAAQAGKSGSKLAKAAGYSPSPAKLEQFSAAKAIEAGKNPLDVDFADQIKAFAPYAKADIRATGGIVDDMGSVWDGPIGRLKMGSKEVEVPLARNPIVRGRQQAVIKAQNRFETAPLIGSASVGARVSKRSIDGRAKRELSVMTRAADEAVNVLDDVEMGAFRLANYRQQGISREKLIDHYKTQLARVERDESKIDPEMPTDGNQARTQLAGQALRQRISEISDDAAWGAADEAAWTPNVAAAMEAVHGVSVATSRSLYDMSGGTLRGKPIEFEDFFELQRGREAMHIEDPDIEWFDGYDGDVITADDLINYRNENGYKPGKFAYVRPHTQYAEASKLKPLRSDPELGKPGVGHTKKNQFLTFDDALDVLEPQKVLQAARDVVMYKASVQKYHAILDSAQQFSNLADVPNGWGALGSEKMSRYIDTTAKWLAEDASVVFGDGPELGQVREVLARLQDQSDTAPLYAPKSMVDELVGDLEKGNEFIKKWYDGATNIWRSLTLTFRPVWITGNLVGQLALLVTTHGLMKGSAAWFQAVRMGKGHIADLTAPDVLGAGFIHSAMDEAVEFRGKSDTLVSTLADKLGDKKNQGADLIQKVWGSQEKILQFNSWLTDDIPRRAAFWIEVKPHAERIARETGLSVQDAAVQWLESSPKVVDRLAQKVLSDLVDFKNLTKFERAYLRRIMPFYSWLRGATGRTMRLTMDEPWKAWAGAEASKWGQEELQEDLGGAEIPDFLRGALTLGENEDGQRQIITSNSLNPFATIGDVAGMAKGATVGDLQVGGANVASTFNPFLKAGIESFTNRDLFYGTPLDKPGDAERGLLARYADQIYSGIPQVRAVDKLTGALSSEGTGYTPLFDPSVRDTLLSYLLAPTKKLNIKEASERARDESAPLI